MNITLIDHRLLSWHAPRRPPSPWLVGPEPVSHSRTRWGDCPTLPNRAETGGNRGLLRGFAPWLPFVAGQIWLRVLGAYSRYESRARRTARSREVADGRATGSRPEAAVVTSETPTGRATGRWSRKKIERKRMPVPDGAVARSSAGNSKPG
jgi:hypothetical protein